MSVSAFFMPAHLRQRASASIEISTILPKKATRLQAERVEKLGRRHNGGFSALSAVSRSSEKAGIVISVIWIGLPIPA
jgi:hypothetical protein